MAMTGPLSGLLQYEGGYGGQGLTQEQYDMLGGDALLANLRLVGGRSVQEGGNFSIRGVERP